MGKQISLSNSLQISSLGLGAARLGSVTGATTKEADRLINIALDNGVTFFDTATSYGQGDSERIIGKVLRGRDHLFIVSKIGKVVPAKARLLRPLKQVIRALGRRSKNLKGQVQQSRGRQLPTNFDPLYLKQQLDASRKRLGMACVPCVMLHSPTAEVLNRGDAIDFLENQKENGNIGLVGVSVDDVPAAKAALSDARVQAVQLPYRPNDKEMSDLVNRMSDSGKLIIAREIFHGVKSIPDEGRESFIKENLRRSLEDNNIGVSLIGTTNYAHLEELLNTWKVI